MKVYWIFVLIASSFVVGINAETRVAIARLLADGINGTILFTEVDGGVEVTGTITGLPAGHYGFHIHEFGDITTCDTTGAHFDLDGNNHGARDHDVRHVGDLGNVEFVGDGAAGVATLDLVDHVISLRGSNSVLGRALVLHEQEDDLGLGGHENSLTTGNAGARVACGVIGIKSGEWNSSTTAAPSIALVLLIGLVSYFVKQ